MIRKYTMLLLFSTVIHFALAQEMNKKLKLYSISSIGVLNGSRGTALALQTILGVNYHKTFFGLGGGLDYYRYRTIPVFIDLRHEFGNGKRNLFVYGDLGYNYEWLVNEKTEQANIYELQHRFRGGLYYDAGAGYKIGFNKRDALLLSAGYSFKKLTSETGSGTCPVIGPCYDAIQTYRYYLPRFAIKAGWRF